MEWRTDIENAPKDGTRILVCGYQVSEIYDPEDEQVVVAAWFGGKSDYDGDDWWGVHGGVYYGVWIRPRLWAPIPEPLAP
jgi:hypothetical protein